MRHCIPLLALLLLPACTMDNEQASPFEPQMVKAPGYQLVDLGLFGDWYAASAYSLVKIDSNKENSKVQKVLEKDPTYYDCWIGLHRVSWAANGWQWEDGSAPTYTNWGPGQPDCTQATCGDYPGVMMASGGPDVGRWFDVSADSYARYACTE